MLHVFGLSMPTPTRDAGRDVAVALADRMTAAAATLQRGAPAAVAAGVRHDAQRYLAARRRGELRFAGGAGRACDEGALALMRLTVDAPAVVAVPAPMVA
jgi:hypothetical protein